MCWATQLIAVYSHSGHSLMLKSLHSWEGRREQITEGLKTCTCVHVHTREDTTDLTSIQLWMLLNELVWLAETLPVIMEEEEEPTETHWIETSWPRLPLPPSPSKAQTALGELQACEKQSGVCRKGEECRASRPPAAAVPWCFNTCRSTNSLWGGCFYGDPFPGCHC